MKALDVNRVRASIGSFWYDAVDAESLKKLELVSRASTLSNIHQTIGQVNANLRGSKDIVTVENITLTGSWSETEIDSATWYLLSTVMDFLPLRIEVAGVVYSLGVDYVYIPSVGQVAFRENPGVSTMVILDAIRTRAGTLAFAVPYGLFLSPTTGAAEHIAKYLRGDHTIPALLDALRAILNLERLDVGGVLRKKQVDNGRVTYLFDNEKVVINYIHEELVEGVYYTPGTWVGKEIVEIDVYDNTTTWYRNSDWSYEGLDLTNIVGLQGLKAEDADTVVSNVGGQAQFDLTGDPGVQTQFWQRAASREGVLGGGIELKYAITSTVNPIDIFFQDFLDHGMILRLDARVIKPRAIYGIVNWVERNLPFGYLPIIRIISDTGDEINFASYNPTITGIQDSPTYGLGGFLFYNDDQLYYDTSPLIYL